jgi:flavin-dependent dehydrogenase
LGSPPNPESDLLVVGGGPAGLATAIRARLSGLSVRLIDRSRPPIDKACGEGLMPDGAARLRELGVEIPAAGRATFRGIRYFDGELMAEGHFPGSPGYGVRRIDLHRALVRRAEASGAELNWGVRAVARRAGAVVTDRGAFPARWIVAADGLHSPLRRWAGLDAPAARRRRYGVRRHFTIQPWSDFIEVYWGEGCEAYVTPVGSRRVGVALLWSGAKSSFDELLERFTPVRRRVSGAPVESEDRGAGPLEQRVRAVVRGNLALVGDASGYVDAITGEGLALAFHQACAVVEAIERNDLGSYAAAHRRLIRLPGIMTRLLLWVERHPRLRGRLISALAADPALFSRLLGVHARELPPARLGLDGARLAWRLVAA